MKAHPEHPADPALVGLIFGAALAGCGLRRCGWCWQWMGLARELAEGQITDGICPACLATEMATLDRVLPAQEVGSA